MFPQPATFLAIFGLTSPISGEQIATVVTTSAAEATAAIARADTAFQAWRNVPAPRRGELVRLLGEELRIAKADLGHASHAGSGQNPV